MALAKSRTCVSRRLRKQALQHSGFEGTKEAACCNSSITRPEPLYDGKRPGRTERAPLCHSASAITTGAFAYNALRSVCLSGGAPERLGWCRWIRTRFWRPAQRANKKGRIGCPSQPIRPCHRSKIIATCPSRRAPGTSQRALYHALQSSDFPKAAMLFGLSRQHRRTCEPP